MRRSPVWTIRSNLESICIVSRLVDGTVTGFGNGGPLEQRPASDTIGQVFGGLYSLLGPPGSADLDGATSADPITGLCQATRVLDSLVHRSTNGDRQQVDTTPTCR